MLVNLPAEPLILGNMQPMVDERRELVVAGEILDLRVERKRVKNINARLRGNILYVSAPHRVPKTELDEKIERLARQLVRRRRADTVNADGAAEAIALKVAARFADPPQVTEVRFATTQRSRWGSYSPRTGIIRLNAALRLMPPWVLEAVVAHELAHAFHADHSPAFWELARSACPKTDRARAFLEGVTWLASSWENLPPVERAQLSSTSESC
jgi:predicted metal-dependent hydrolase